MTPSLVTITDAEVQIRYLIGEVLTAHERQVQLAEARLADAERGVQYAKERYDASPWPDRRLSEHLGQMEEVVTMRAADRERLDGAPAAQLARAVRDLLDAEGSSHHPAAQDGGQADG